jgi:uncharacterized protein YdaU (DUF1376 family)
MFKPDSYMPFYGNDFFQGVKGMNIEIKMAYLEAIWYYWSVNNCRGLRNDEDFLRSICGLEGKSIWPAAFQTLFDDHEFFTLGADDKWHQKRAYAEYQKSKVHYDQRVNAGKKRGQKRGHGKHFS